MGYTKPEQETVLVFDYEQNVWNAYSTVPKHIRKLMTIGNMMVVEEENGRPISVIGELTEKQVSMKKQRIISEETKEKLRLNALAMLDKTE